MMFENIEMGKNITLVCKDKQCAVFRVIDETGDGTMTMYNVFPGVVVLYNDFHMGKCFSGFRPDKDIFCVDHCREGRIEWEMKNNNYIYFESGDMQVSNRNYHTGDFNFPLSHYHGITVGFMPEETEQLSNMLEGLTFDIPEMKQKFCPEEHPFIMRAGVNIEHIFSELYSLPDHTRIPYLKIKVLELLLFLNMLEKPECSGDRPYFHKAQVNKVKEIRTLLIENLECHYTLEDLSQRFDFPLTAMKLCFKGVYGTSVYAYIKAYRINTAAMMLRRSGDNVADIAIRIGYDNASKFAAAFKSMKGMTPAEYRKSTV